MENKINIAELLKDCPSGMELDCTMFDNVTFIGVGDIEKQFPIEIKISGNKTKYLTKTGCFHDDTLVPEAKCVIFPKGKTTWEGFQRPFKDGDILVLGDTIYIYNGLEELSPYPSHYVYVIADKNGLFAIDTSTKKYGTRFATEEEKEILFKAIKDNGYKWNAETKILEKLIEPKFKVGDRIRHKEKTRWACTISRVEDRYYVDGHPMCYTLPLGKQNEYELVPNKFDITTLKPFDKVLVRDSDKKYWSINFFGFYNEITEQFHCLGNTEIGWDECIPYEVNKELLGTTNNPKEYGSE